MVVLEIIGRGNSSAVSLDLGQELSYEQALKLENLSELKGEPSVGLPTEADYGVYVRALSDGPSKIFSGYVVAPKFRTAKHMARQYAKHLMQELAKFEVEGLVITWK